MEWSGAKRQLPEIVESLLERFALFSFRVFAASREISYSWSRKRDDPKFV